MSPDRRAHRGLHPEDGELFSESMTPVLWRAVQDLSAILGMGYADKAALKLVGDRHRLAARQRMAVARAACTDGARDRRAASRTDLWDLSGADLAVDGFNLLITVEAALSGGVLLLCRDGCLRDMASVHSTYRAVEETDDALALIGEVLVRYGPASVRWLFDEPVSNSGRIATRVQALAASRGWPWTAEAVESPDRTLAQGRAVAVTADSAVLDRAARWANLARAVVDRAVPEAYRVDLGGEEPGVPAFGVREPGRSYTRRPSAYAVVLDGAKRCAVLPTPLRLFLPGGGLEPGESHEAALTREVREETGFAVEILEDLGRADQFFFAAREAVHFLLQARFFRARFLPGHQAANRPEHHLAWVDVDEAREGLYHESHRWALDRAAGRALRTGGGEALDPAIVSHYGRTGYEETRCLSGTSRLELARQRELLTEALPAPPATLVDAGGGPGRYARWLTALGYEVLLADPVHRHVSTARNPEGEGPPPALAVVGDGRRLPFPSGVVDGVLLFGPLYHLTERAERVRALREARRLLRPGGVVVCTYIGRYASLLDGLVRGFLADPVFRDIVARDLRTGRHANPTGEDAYFTTAYFHHPRDIGQEMARAGLVHCRTVGVEGPGWMLGDFDRRWDDEEERARLLEAARLVGEEPTLWGASAHLLAVGRKPA